jgi:triacylglycerol lipase
MKSIIHFFNKIFACFRETIIFPLTYILSCFGFKKVQIVEDSKIHPPIVLIHGYLNSRVVWFYYCLLFRRKNIYPIYAINLGWPFSSIETFSKRLQKKMIKLNLHNADNIIFVGHSMGGLVASYYALNLDQKKAAIKIITIASPFKGTRVAKIAFGKCAKQMEIGSSFLKDLGEQINTGAYFDIFNIASTVDHIVVPFNSAIIHDNKDTQRIFPYYGHASLLYSSEVHEKICQWIAQETKI